MKVVQFSETQYLQTMNGRMVDITETAKPLADVWGYAAELMQAKLLSQYEYEERFVEAVYANGDNTYQHVLLYGNKKNIYVVILIDVVHESIAGHFILDLNEKYGLEQGG